jgi:hypothetical protein
MSRRDLLAVGVAAIGWVGCAVQAGAEGVLPEGTQGFSGEVHGSVVGKTEAGGFAFKVGKVLRLWDDNKAEKAALLEGQTISVRPGRAKAEDGTMRPAELQAAFIRRAQPGQEFRLQVRNVERDAFVVTELSADQGAWARGDVREGERAGREPAAGGRERVDGAGEPRERVDAERRETAERERRALGQREERGAGPRVSAEGEGRERTEPERRERVDAERRDKSEIERRERGEGVGRVRPAAEQEREVLVKVLRDEIRQLNSEAAEMRRQIEQLRDENADLKRQAAARKGE